MQCLHFCVYLALDCLTPETMSLLRLARLCLTRSRRLPHSFSCNVLLSAFLFPPSHVVLRFLNLCPRDKHPHTPTTLVVYIHALPPMCIQPLATVPFAQPAHRNLGLPSVEGFGSYGTSLNSGLPSVEGLSPKQPLSACSPEDSRLVAPRIQGL